MKFLGISGVAGSGKDLLFELLSQQFKCIRFSIADALKEEINEWTLPKYGINCLTCDREEKELLRPLLVLHGSFLRNLSDGRHWIELLNKKIKKIKKSDYDFGVITDIRFDEYEKDEVFWLKKELEGLLIHVSQYQIKEVTSKIDWPRKESAKVFVEAANILEKENDPKIKNKSNFQVEWERVEMPEDQRNEILIKKYIKPLLLQINSLTK